jgi:two-component system chemotaxis sensor kinase CheA
MDLSDNDREAILQVFLLESEEHLVRMEGALIALETQPDDEDLLQTIFRLAHTMKGNASTLEFQSVERFAHVLEDLLHRLRSRALPVTEGLITLLLQASDVLREMVADAAAGIEEMHPAHAALLKRLAEESPTATVKEETLSRASDNRRTRPFGRRRQDVAAWADHRKTLRIDMNKLDDLLDRTAEITIARGRFRQLLEDRDHRSWDALLEAHRVMDRLCMELQEQIMKVRMVPVGPTFRQHLRTVRDVARMHGKAARLVIEGEEVEVDTTVVEHLKDPLTHMIRNAIDHGIEPPEIRRERGKDPTGLIRLRAAHEAGSLVIRVSDDGEGFHRERILRQALRTGLLAESQHLSDGEVYRLVFEPGFSTAETVTELSGRGVGMDVVRRNIEALRGTIGIESRQGAGSTITIRLPLTLAIIDGFLVGVGDQSYVIPLDAVLECLKLPEGEEPVNGSGVINLRGEALPYLRLREAFGLGGEAPGAENIIVVRHAGEKAGFAVDHLHGEVQTVIKPMGKLFHGLPCISGSTILGNGRVALILDAPTLLQEAARRGSALVG